MTSESFEPEAAGRFPFPNSFQFRDEEALALEGLFEKALFNVPYGAKAIEALRSRRFVPPACGATSDAAWDAASPRPVVLCRGADGIGKGIFRFEPFLAIGQIIPGDNFVQLQGGAELSTDLDVAAHEIFWRGALGHTFTQGRFGRAWSPMVEVVGGWEVEDDAEVEWSLVPELHVALTQRQHVMLVLGAEIPVTRFEERQITVMLSLLWDWFDGGFTEGW